MDMKNTCMCCYTQGVEDGGICPICKFGNSTRTGDSDTVSEQKKKKAEEHRKRILGKTQISVVGYEHQVVGNEIRLKKKNLVEFPMCSDLQIGQTYWLGQQFAQDEKHLGKNWDLNLEIKIEEKDYKKQKVSVKTFAESGAIQVGLSMEPGLKAKIHLKNTKMGKESTSEEIKILGK